MNQILCSSGVLSSNSYSPNAQNIIEISKHIHADGFELMILSNWYGNSKMWAEALKENKIYTPIGHLSKSDIVKCYESGDSEVIKQGHQKLIEDCEVLSDLNISKAVMHLWGWPDNNFDSVLSALKEAVKISSSHNIELLVETLPTRFETLIKRMEQVVEVYPDCRFTADIRLLRRINMQDEIFDVNWIWDENRIAHVHVSDCGINENGHVMITPTLQLGDGIIDLSSFFSNLKEKDYTGMITLESGGFDRVTGELQVNKINESLDFIRKSIV